MLGLVHQLPEGSRTWGRQLIGDPFGRPDKQFPVGWMKARRMAAATTVSCVVASRPAALRMKVHATRVAMYRRRTRWTAALRPFVRSEITSLTTAGRRSGRRFRKSAQKVSASDGADCRARRSRPPSGWLAATRLSRDRDRCVRLARNIQVEGRIQPTIGANRHRAAGRGTSIHEIVDSLHSSRPGLFEMRKVHRLRDLVDPARDTPPIPAPG